MTKVLYCTGRVHLYQGRQVEALRLFQLAQVAAQESGCSLAASLAAGNEAWAYAELGEPDRAIAASRRATAEFGKGGPGPVPAWLDFYDTAELQSLVATTHAMLPDPTPKQRTTAIEGLEVAVALRRPRYVRSRLLDLLTLARAYHRNGETDEADKVNEKASELAEGVCSERVNDATDTASGSGRADRATTPDR